MIVLARAVPAWSSTVWNGPGASSASATTRPTTGWFICATPSRGRPSSARWARARAILDEFDGQQLDVVQRFVTAMAASLHDHVDGLERNDASVAEGQSGRH